MVFLLDYANMNPIQILNVEIPFYFKNIVDSMNVDFAAIGGTAYTVAGSMIIACEISAYRNVDLSLICFRWRDSNWSYIVSRAPQRGLC